MNRRCRRPLPLLVVAVLGLGACGGEPTYAELARPLSAVRTATAPSSPTKDSHGTTGQAPRSQATATLVAPSLEPTAPPSATRDPDPTRTSNPPDSEPSEPPSDAERLAELAAEVVELTNAERVAEGCAELRPDDRLREAALAHSSDMAERDYLSHVSPEGDGPGDRAAAAGYQRWSGENIARGYATAEDVVDGWMDSEGHRKNILSCDSAAIGVGVAEGDQGPYWTQLFGYE